MLEQAIDLEDRTAARVVPGPDFVLALRRADARHRQAAHPPLRGRRRVTFHHHDVVGAKLTRKRMQALRFAKDTIDAGRAAGRAAPALPRLRRRASGPTPPCAATSATPGRCSTACTCSPAPTARPATSARPSGSRAAYDDLEERIARLAEEEELACVRPDLDGNQIVEALGIRPGPVLGEAYEFLLSVRLDDGPIGKDAAREKLLAWWAARGAAD